MSGTMIGLLAALVWGFVALALMGRGPKVTL